MSDALRDNLFFLPSLTRISRVCSSRDFDVYVSRSIFSARFSLFALFTEIVARRRRPKLEPSRGEVKGKRMRKQEGARGGCVISFRAATPMWDSSGYLTSSGITTSRFFFSLV